MLAVPESGVLPVNKPSGMSSHDVVSWARRETGIRKIGHAGTLDPLADGLLILLIGRDATKQQDSFMGQPKVYEGTVIFGVSSESEDAEGPLQLSSQLEDLDTLNAEKVSAAFEKFIGTTEQVPPLYSAIQVDGKRLYKVARSGAASEVVIPTRSITIDKIDLLNFIPLSVDANPENITELLRATPPENLKHRERYQWYANRSHEIQQLLPTARIRVHCQKGVYIRSLARDLGVALNTVAFLGNLTRTHIGEYSLDTAITPSAEKVGGFVSTQKQ